MPAYAGIWSVVSDQPVPAELLALARKLVGTMLETGGIPQRQWNIDNGSTIHALIVNGIPKVTITQTTPAEQPQLNTTDLWVPRGFVVYPAWSDARYGVGLPIVPKIGASADDPANFAPGLDRTRWTAAGECGEVLLSADLRAGYTTDIAIPIPLLTGTTLGPVFRWNGSGSYDARAPTSAWVGYRLELAPFVSHYSEENIATAKALFTAVNSARTTASQVAAVQRFRGYARPAEIAASIFFTASSDDETNPAYPPTYRHSYNRLMKEGYASDWIGVPFTGFDRTHTLTQYEFRADSGTPTDIVAAWASAPGSQLTADIGPCVVADIGYRGAYSVLALAATDRWIHAGNASWQSQDTDLPPISWHSFASVNLAWETYPAVYDPVHYNTAPLVPVRSFTNDQGDCWLKYPRSTSPVASTMEPALGRHIYCRGRAIALAPRGGLVWGACVANNGANDRLIALIHHPDDQPSDYTHQGFTRYLRVWWVDIPKRDHLRLDPQDVVVGIDGTDALGWKGGDQLDLGVLVAPSTGFVASAGVNSLKYASCWRFSPDGLHAVCLRDYGTFGDYGALYSSGSIATYTEMNARAVELTFSLSPTTTDTTLSAHDYTAGATAPDRPIAVPPGTSDVMDKPLFEQGASSLAVDYTSAGQLIYAYNAPIAAHEPVYKVIGSITYAIFYVYNYVGVGGAGVQYQSDLSFRVLHGATIKTAASNYVQNGVVVMDVNTATCALEGTLPRWAAGLDTPLDVPCSPFTTVPVHGVKISKFGGVQFVDWYPAPDGVVFTINDLCFNVADAGATYIELPQAVTRTVQGYYAARFGRYVASYQVSPTPLAAAVLDAAPSDPTCGCKLELTQAATATHWMANAELNPRGGRAISDIVLPSADWLIYSKVV